MSEKELIERFVALIRKQNSLVIGKVKSIEGLSCTVVPLTNEVEISGVALSFDLNPNFIAEPEINSIVVVGFYKVNKLEERSFILFATRVNAIKLCGEEFGGLVKVQELTNRLNLIENKLNDFINNWNNFCNSYVPGSPTTVGTPASLLTETLENIEQTSVGDLENERVTHG